MLERDVLMDKELAQQVAFILRHCSDLLVHVLWLVEHHGTEAQALEHRKAVAHVLTELGVNLLYPIYKEYPDLEPALPPSSEDHEGQFSEKSPQGKNHPDRSDPGDQNS
jgi:hypothetical protein